jgi:uncharacterized protein YukE
MSFGLPGRPGGDPGALSRLSGQWNTLATSLEDSLQQLNPHASWVYDWWQGGGADAYTTSWENYSPHITSLIASIRGVATQLSAASNKISAAQSRYDHLLETAAAAAAGGLFLSVVTVGISDGVAAGVDSGIAGTITAMLIELGDELVGIGEAISAGYAELQGLVLSLQLSLGTASGILVTGGAGAVFGAATLYASGDHDPLDLGVAALFGFGMTADPGFGQAGGGEDDGEPITPVIAPSGEVGIIDQTNSTFSDPELAIAKYYADQGKTVEAVPESTESGVRMFDARIDGTAYEFKSLGENATDSTVKNNLNSAQGQFKTVPDEPKDVTLDARTSGLTEAQAQKGVSRYLGTGPNPFTTITILGNGWTLTVP